MSALDNLQKTPPRSAAWIAIMPIVFFVFSGALNNNFVDWDDPYFITDNPMIRSLTRDNLWKMATSFKTASWYPLTWLSHAVDYHFFLLDPAGHRLTNIILHCLNSIWVFLLFTRLAGKSAPELQNGQSLFLGGIIAALLFGIHPLRVEPVVWISARKDLLCAFFVMATYWAYLAYVFALGKKKRGLWYFAALFLFLLALMSKPIAVAVPASLLLLDVFPLKRLESWAQSFPLLLEKLPFFGLSLVYGAITLNSQEKVGGILSVTAADKILNAAESVLFYIGKTVCPIHLVPLYPFPKKISLLNGGLSLAAVILITVIGIQMWRNHRPALPAAWFYYLVMVSPVIGVIQVGRQAAADRYSYLPTLGFYFLAGIGVARLWEKNSFPALPDAARRALILLVAFIVLSSFGYLTVQQSKVWKNSETLWSYVVKSFPAQSSVAEFSLGKIYNQKGLLREAEEKYKTALAIDPAFVGALNGLGLVYYNSGQYDKAETEYKRALKIHPDSVVRNNLGLLYLKKGQMDGAQAEFLVALALDPNNLEAHNNLGLLYNSLGRLKEAEHEYKTAITINFDFALAHLNLGVLYKGAGMLKQAETEFKMDLYLEPERTETHVLLGEIYSMMGLKTEAEIEFKEAQRRAQTQK